MHKESKLLSLDQRRQIQLLSLMFTHRLDINVQRVNARNTRASQRYRFYKERYNSVKYKDNPYYKGAELWDHLLLDTINSVTLFEFKTCLKKTETNTYVANAGTLV